MENADQGWLARGLQGASPEKRREQRVTVQAGGPGLSWFYLHAKLISPFI